MIVSTRRVHRMYIPSCDSCSDLPLLSRADTLTSLNCVDSRKRKLQTENWPTKQQTTHTIVARSSHSRLSSSFSTSYSFCSFPFFFFLHHLLLPLLLLLLLFLFVLLQYRVILAGCHIEMSRGGNRLNPTMFTYGIQ